VEFFPSYARASHRQFYSVFGDFSNGAVGKNSRPHRERRRIVQTGPDRVMTGFLSR